MLLEIASRPIDTDTSFTTGGDVSRFQRTTVPPKPDSGAPAVATPGAAIPRGPVIIIARGNTVSQVPLGRN
jgi:pilus assembly protein CpaB